MKFLLAATLLAAACAEPTPKHLEPQQHMTGSGNSSFTVFVSNQAIQKHLVDIQVSIDGQLAISGDFNTYGTGGHPSDPHAIPQHAWFEYSFALDPGAHTIRVESADYGQPLERTFTLGTAPLWGTVSFWGTPDYETDHFSFDEHAEEPVFL